MHIDIPLPKPRDREASLTWPLSQCEALIEALEAAVKRGDRDDIVNYLDGPGYVDMMGDIEVRVRHLASAATPETRAELQAWHRRAWQARQDALALKARIL